MKALVIHARRTGYGVIRSLHRLGVEIIIADDEATPVFKSNMIGSSYILPKITDVTESEFVDRLLLIGKKEFSNSKIIVFTGKDDYLLFFSKNIGILSKYFVLSFESNYSILKNVLGKKSLAKIANSAGVLIPLTLDNDSKEEEYSSIRYPVIIKPDFKNLPEKDVVTSAFRVRLCRDGKELNKARDTLVDLKLEYVVQQYIPGEDSELYTVGAYVFNGQLVGYSTARKVRQFPVNTGECSYGELIDLEGLVPPCIALAKESGFTGICQIEFKKMKDEYYLIEINPRVWSWHEIHCIAGVDLVKICIDTVLLNKKYAQLIRPQKGKTGYWHFSLMDLLHNVILNKNISIYTWLKTIKKSNLHAFYTPRDIKPVINHWIKTIPYVFKCYKNNNSEQ